MCKPTTITQGSLNQGPSHPSRSKKGCDAIVGCACHGGVKKTWRGTEDVWRLPLHDGAPKIAKLVYNSNNYGLWYL